MPHGSDAIRAELLARGAMIDARDVAGWTPLAIAAARGNTRMVKLLLAANADPTIQTDDGFTPLDAAKDFPETRTLLRAARST